MKQLLLATALIALPVAVFTVVEMRMAPESGAAVTTDPLGDLSAYESVVADTRAIAVSGDLTGAEARISNLETMWDEAAATLRAMDAAAWGNVDGAADAAFSALRARNPDPAKVQATLVALSSTLANPSGASGDAGPATLVSGIAVTDANGHALPCEAMLSDLRIALADGSIAVADTATVTALQAKATERCNADDDTRADAFAAQALALATR